MVQRAEDDLLVILLMTVHSSYNLLGIELCNALHILGYTIQNDFV